MIVDNKKALATMLRLARSYGWRVLDLMHDCGETLGDAANFSVHAMQVLDDYAQCQIDAKVPDHRDLTEIDGDGDGIDQ